MKILVIGHSVLDKIIIDGKEEIKPGGIYYTVSALNKIKSDDEVFLCTSIEDEIYSYFKDEYSKCFTKHIQFGSKIPRVNLYINPGQERCEKYENVNSPLNIPVHELNTFDAILINMITGFDISLSQLKEIRNNFNGLIYFDVHTLSRGLDSDMKRSFRRIKQFNEWKDCLDIIQVNEHELFSISSKEDELSVAKDVLLNKAGKRPCQLIITKGELGAKVYNVRNDEVKSFYLSASKVDVHNTIGLGDTFGAVYYYTYLKTKSFYRALELAVLAGALAASPEGFNKLDIS